MPAVADTLATRLRHQLTRLSGNIIDNLALNDFTAITELDQEGRISVFQRPSFAGFFTQTFKKENPPPRRNWPVEPTL